MLSSALSTGAMSLDLVGLVGLVGSRSLTDAPKFTPDRLNAAAPAPLHFGGFGGFHGIVEPQGRAEISADGRPMGSTEHPGIGGFGGFHGVVAPQGRAEISAAGLPTGCTDQPRIGGFGGFYGVVEPQGRAEISSAEPPQGCTDQARIGGFGGFHGVVEPQGRAEISSDELPMGCTDQARIGGFGGFYGVVEPQGRAEISSAEPPQGCTDQARIGGFGGFHGVVEPQGRAEISSDELPMGCTDQARIGGFGGFHEVVEPYGRATISTAAPQISDDTSAAEDAEALLRHLRELGISVELEASGALRVTPASLLPQELRDAIKANRDALAELLDAAGLRDDRRRCSECRHFRPYGGCAEAARGNMPGVSPRMIPMKDVLQRCDWFKAHRDFGGDY